MLYTISPYLSYNIKNFTAYACECDAWSSDARAKKWELVTEMYVSFGNFARFFKARERDVIFWPFIILLRTLERMTSRKEHVTFSGTCGAMDNASAYGAEDSRFESWQVRFILSKIWNLLEIQNWLHQNYMGSNKLKVGQNSVVVKDHTNKKYEHQGKYMFWKYFQWSVAMLFSICHK